MERKNAVNILLKLLSHRLLPLRSERELPLAVLILSGSIEFIPMQVIPIAGMIAGNAMVAVGLCYNNLGQRVIGEQQQIQEKLSLGATPKQASAILIRDSIRGFNSTVDSAKTVGLVSLPGMMSG